jgi:serine/threonine protein kinase
VTWIARFIEVARALELAHSSGVVHRDIKPSNLFLERSGRLVVLDFGLTRSSQASTTLTASPVGTPRYMSPEQILVHTLAVDGRSDEFSLAATLYELLVLEPAFAGDERERVFHAILSIDPLPLRALDPRVPRDLEVVLLHALEKEQQRRSGRSAASRGARGATPRLRRRSRLRPSRWSHCRSEPRCTPRNAPGRWSRASSTRPAPRGASSTAWVRASSPPRARCAPRNTISGRGSPSNGSACPRCATGSPVCARSASRPSRTR